jgi:hypothetical protein
MTCARPRRRRSRPAAATGPRSAARSAPTYEVVDWTTATLEERAQGKSRHAVLRYLVKHRELTGLRLLTLHNLAFLARLMADLRAAVVSGTLAERARALRAGDAPAVVEGRPGRRRGSRRARLASRRGRKYRPERR